MDKKLPKGELLAKRGSARVYQQDNIRWLQLGNNHIQAQMDTKSIASPQLHSVKALLAGLAFVDAPRNIINIGLGGGSVERFLSAYLPAVSIISIEPDTDVVRLARQYFYFSDDWPVVIDTAENFLSRKQDCVDVIICDIFQDERHPSCLYEAGFYENCANSLSGKGLLMVNLAPADTDDCLAILVALRSVFTYSCLVPVTDTRNCIIYASRQPMLSLPSAIKGGEWLQNLGVDVAVILDGATMLPPTAH